MADSLVTVAQFHVSGDAAVAKHAMDNAGIESEVEDIRLEVHNEDAFRAYHVLDTDCETLPVLDEPYEVAKIPTVCIACGSAAIVRSVRGVTFAGLATIAIGVGVAIGYTDAAFFAIGAAGLYFLMTGRWRCTDCRESWG
jgi:hypothetical protein